jgi:uncharacterized protein (DUF433 family)
MSARDAAARRAKVLDAPAYTLAEAAAFLHMSPSTLRAWTAAPAPLVNPADRAHALLSFNNLVELHVLAALRWRMGMSMQVVQRALGYMEASVGSRPLLTADLHSANGRGLLVNVLGKLVDPTRAGQLVMRPMADPLKRIERDDHRVPIRLFPFGSKNAPAESPRDVVIDPGIQFGRPCLAGTNVPTVEVAARFNAGESKRDLAYDFGITPHQVDAALRFHRAA